MKKITALILAIILCFTLAIPALGSEMSVNGQAYSINGIDVYKYPLKASQYFSVETIIYFVSDAAFAQVPVNDDVGVYYTTHPIEKQYIVAMLRDPKRIFFLTVNYLSDPELIQETNLAFYRLFSSGIMNMQMTIIPENTTIEDLRANCTEFSYWVIDEKNGDIILEITSDTGNLIQVIIENAS